MSATRRDFFAITGAAAAPPVARQLRRNERMHVGGDYHSVAGGDFSAKTNLEYHLRHGVTHLTAQLRGREPDGAWDLEEMRRIRENCGQAGVEWEAIRMDAEYIGLRPGPERDRRLAAIVENIGKAAQVGVKIISYHWTLIPIRRNVRAPGRGGSSYAGFKLEDNWQSLPQGKAGRVNTEDYWERITHFLKAAVPAAERHGVLLACHPYDPPGLPLGYQGADNWDAPSIFDGIRRYESIVNSRHNGFQLCLGTVAEGLRNPRTEILPIVQYLSERGKLHQIHMRNIRGGLHNFLEVYPDEGDLDFLAILRILRDTQYPGSILPDHMPRHTDDPGGLQAFAFGYGYLKALIQAVNAEAK